MNLQHVDPRGSLWRRWEPHIHPPGTVRNNGYTGSDPWREFASQIDSFDPAIEVLGITDYLSIDRYVEALEKKDAGYFPRVKLLFPNVEMRFGISTSKGGGVNLHLLFAPDDSDHVAQIRRFLQKLKFHHREEDFHCCRDDLVRLGRAYGDDSLSEQAALAEGTNQFKVNFDELRTALNDSKWAKENCLVAVAAGESDGTSGLRDESNSFGATRKNIEAFSHIIFSANPKTIEFWLGRGSATLSALSEKWGGTKPCLHGSDAHGPERVGKPDLDRYSWIKGDPTFESLRQACIAPEDRVFVGPRPPRGAMASQAIAEVAVSKAPWFSPQPILLNPGLVAIIGARGSGKTALADLIAAGGQALVEQLADRKSFLHRASEFLQESKVTLCWESGDPTVSDLRDVADEQVTEIPRVEYLSQQFVDTLCSSEGLADSLMKQIEQVVFNAHPAADRLGATSFNEFREIRSAASLERRSRYEEELLEASRALAEERELKRSIPSLRKLREEKAKLVEKDKLDRKALIPKGNEERVRQHAEAEQAVEAKRKLVDEEQRRTLALQGLQEDVKDIRNRRSPAISEELVQSRREARLTTAEWEHFRLSFPSLVDEFLANKIAATSALIARLRGDNIALPKTESTGDVVQAPLIPAGAKLAEQPLRLLEAELARLARLVGVDAQNARRFQVLSQKITTEESSLGKLDKQIEHAVAADSRIAKLLERRKEAYAGVFEAVVEQERQLRAIYAPLAARLAGSAGPLGQLSFTVLRNVEIGKWSEAGEALLDLRKTGPFKGHGGILTAALKTLMAAWESGGPEEVSAAMAQFIADNELGLREHRPDTEHPYEWAKRVTRWLHDTSHISVAYSLSYDGLDISALSQGTRGIVLLLLYLAIDLEDDRPLIIDQPEENLDPQSIFTELVKRFRETKRRRQVIIVTHNANLVVNADADQVIIARCGAHKAGKLPMINYYSGGLENAEIRKHVCEILEGGEEAFRERAKRLRLMLA